MHQYIILIIILCGAISVRAQESGTDSDSPKHCLAPNTKITMHDDSMKDISEVKEGDIVISFNLETKEYEKAKVVKVHTIMHNRYLRITIKNGAFVEATADQPFLTTDGWVSMSPVMTINSYERYKDKKVEQLDGGTKLLYYDITSTNEIEVVSIDGVVEIVDTYSLELDNNGAYIANSFIVGQE